jgi:hypothetical protein
MCHLFFNSEFPEGVEDVHFVKDAACSSALWADMYGACIESRNYIQTPLLDTSRYEIGTLEEAISSKSELIFQV